MVTIKDKYQKKLDEYTNKLVKLGETLYQCKLINPRTTSIEYKQNCIDNTNELIEETKQLIDSLFITTSKDENLDFIIEYKT